MTDTNQLLRDAQQALESARHAIRNLVQTRPAVQWTKWLAVSGECDAVNDAIAAHLAAQPEAHPLTTNPVVRHEGLDLTDKAQAAQSGMVMVPREPTEAWLDDVIVKAKVWPKDGIHYVPEAIREAVRTYHAAMIAAPQTVPQMLTDEEIALAIFEARVGHSPFKRDGSTSFRIARAAIAKFCEVNGITAKGDGNG